MHVTLRAITHLQEKYCLAATVMKCTWLMLVLRVVDVVHDLQRLLLA